MQIALLIFCFLTIAGAFTAWRRSPLYSLKTTFKLAGAILLIIATVAGTTYAIMNSALSRSPLVEIIAALAALLALTCASSIFIVRITDKHVAQLPPSARLVSFNRHKVSRWIWRLVVFLLINTAACLMLPSDWKWLPMALGGSVLFLCGPTLCITYMMARRNDRGMTAVMANPWAHWQYTPEKWAQWAESQRAWEEAKEGPWSWKSASLFVLLCAGLFALGTLLTGGSIEENVIIWSGLTGFLILLTLGAHWFKGTNFDRRYRRLLAAQPETWLGNEGLFSNGKYTPWILSGRYLLKATASIDPPPHLTLIFESFNGSSSTQIIQRVLIPDGYITELPALQQKLKSHCPTASVHLSAQ
ncbi:MAG TPA: hypothetical protein VJX73_13150 [Terracidiphilus sp.]|nr:hypothetical protein [Terracidiphilus sp.]